MAAGTRTPDLPLQTVIDELIGNRNSGAGMATARISLAALASLVSAINVRGTVGDINYTMLVSDRYLALTTVLTLPRIWTLPLANTLPGGTRIIIQDEIGGISPTNTLTLTRSGTDTINGASGVVLRGPYAGFSLVCDGIGKFSYPASRGLPIALPASAGIEWSNGGVVSIS